MAKLCQLIYCVLFGGNSAEKRAVIITQQSCQHAQQNELLEIIFEKCNHENCSDVVYKHICLSVIEDSLLDIVQWELCFVRAKPNN